MNGIIILDKPAGFTSFDAVAVVRGLTKEKKIGHTGTLDPMATGVLPLLLGRAAKAASLLPDTDKEYWAEFQLGQRFDTGDVTGALLETDSTEISQKTLEQAMAGFRGEIHQVPPMYSAVSVNGQRLYKLARQGIEVEREARRVHISLLRLERYDPVSRRGGLRVACSKGTYIRVLIEDIAAAAGTCGTMAALRRVRACGFDQGESVSLERLRELAAAGRVEEVLRPTDGLFRGYREVRVSGPQGTRFANGGALDLERLRLAKPESGERLRVYGPEGNFLGLGEADRTAGQLKVLKLF